MKVSEDKKTHNIDRLLIISAQYIASYEKFSNAFNSVMHLTMSLGCSATILGNK